MVYSHMNNLRGYNVPVFRGKKLIHTGDVPLITDEGLLINSQKRIDTEEFIINFFYEFLKIGGKLEANGVGIKLLVEHDGEYHYVGLVKNIKKIGFQIISRRCRPEKLPVITFNTYGKPTIGTNSKTSRIYVNNDEPTKAKEVAIFVTKLPCRYIR